MSGPEGRTRYGYDALGRRTTATTDGKTVRYVYDGDDVVQRIGADGTRTTYLRGPDGTPLASSSRRTCHGAAAGPVRQRRRRGGRRRCREALLLRPVRCDSACSGRAGIPWAAVRRLRSAGDGCADLRPDQWTVPVAGHVGDRGWGRRPVPLRPRRARPSTPIRADTRPSASGWRWAGRCRRSGPAVAGTTTTPWRTRSMSGQISQDEWTVQADRVSHDLWAGFDVVANVCGTSAVGSSAAALPLLGAGKVGSRVLGSLADDAVTGAAAPASAVGLVTLRRVSASAHDSTFRRLLAQRRRTRLTQQRREVHAAQCRSESFDRRTVCVRPERSMTLGGPREVVVAPHGRDANRVSSSRTVNFYSLGHRRLFGGVQYAEVDLPYRWATLREIVTTAADSDDGRSIDIRSECRGRNEATWGWWRP